MTEERQCHYQTNARLISRLTQIHHHRQQDCRVASCCGVQILDLHHYPQHINHYQGFASAEPMTYLSLKPIGYHTPFTHISQPAV